jgi:hypothetical protein
LHSHFHIQLAESASEFESAFQLLQQTRQRLGLADSRETGPLWLLKQHALPATNTVVALLDGRVVGAICVFGDSPFRLPSESNLDLKPLRSNLEGRLAELSVAAFDPGFAENRDLMFALYHFAFCFGTTYCNYDGFVTEASTAWAKHFAEPLGFSGIYEPIQNRQMLYLNSREAADLRSVVGSGFHAHYHFPEKKFFLVAHQNMGPSVLNYLFNERTQLFRDLSDSDLRVLKNVYDWGDYARLLPTRDNSVPLKKAPRFPRFPMSCEGFLVNENGAHEHVELLDVSREGLKIRIAQLPDKGASYVLTLFVGVNRRSELIAHTVWIDKRGTVAGLEIRSSDAEWSQLLRYLEKDFLRVG